MTARCNPFQDYQKGVSKESHTDFRATRIFGTLVCRSPAPQRETWPRGLRIQNSDFSTFWCPETLHQPWGKCWCYWNSNWSCRIWQVQCVGIETGPAWSAHSCRHTPAGQIHLDPGPRTARWDRQKHCRETPQALPGRVWLLVAEGLFNQEIISKTEFFCTGCSTRDGIFPAYRGASKRTPLNWEWPTTN